MKIGKLEVLLGKISNPVMEEDSNVSDSGILTPLLQANTVLDSAPFTRAVDCLSLLLNTLDDPVVTCVCV